MPNPLSTPLVAPAAAFAVAALVAMGAVACSSPTDVSADLATTSASTAADPEADSNASLQAPPAPDPASPEILVEIRALMARQACNRVTGCPGMTGLMRHGKALIAPAREALLGGKRPDGHWIVTLIELLGQLGDPGATAVLLPLLAENRWEIQVTAARSLAMMGTLLDAATVDQLQQARRLANDDTADGRALAAAIELALIRSEKDGRPFAEARTALFALFPTPDTTSDTPHPQLDVFVRLVSDARLPQALPMVRQALHSGNRFVTATALDVAGSLQDTGAIGFIIPLLDDPNPTLRREAIRALQRITGARQLESADHWRDWATKHGVAIVPMAAARIPGPQVILHPDEMPAP
jgi:HEAT repeat protein